MEDLQLYEGAVKRIKKQRFERGRREREGMEWRGNQIRVLGGAERTTLRNEKGGKGWGEGKKENNKSILRKLRKRKERFTFIKVFKMLT